MFLAQCPQCKTIFQTEFSVLGKQGGMVVCGECGATFNAFDHSYQLHQSSKTAHVTEPSLGTTLTARSDTPENASQDRTQPNQTVAPKPFALPDMDLLYAEPPLPQQARHSVSLESEVVKMEDVIVPPSSMPQPALQTVPLPQTPKASVKSAEIKSETQEKQSAQQDNAFQQSNAFQIKAEPSITTQPDSKSPLKEEKPSFTSTTEAVKAAIDTLEGIAPESKTTQQTVKAAEEIAKPNSETAAKNDGSSIGEPAPKENIAKSFSEEKISEETITSQNQASEANTGVDFVVEDDERETSDEEIQDILNLLRDAKAGRTNFTENQTQETAKTEVDLKKGEEKAPASTLPPLFKDALLAQGDVQSVDENANAQKTSEMPDKTTQKSKKTDKKETASRSARIFKWGSILLLILLLIQIAFFFGPAILEAAGV